MDATIFKNREGEDALAVRIPEGGEGMVALETLASDPLLMEPSEVARLAVNLTGIAREHAPDQWEEFTRHADEARTEAAGRTD